MMRNVSSRRVAFVLGALAVAGAAVAVPVPAFAQPQPPPSQQGPGPGSSDRDWKPEKISNLKVLPKDTTPEQIMQIMRHYTQSLGAGCVMCHKGQVGQPFSTFDFADDGKENKDVARNMIRMTNDINTKYPEAFPEATPGEPPVTCATCHRRTRHPEKDPPPPPPRPEGAPQGQPPAGPPRPPAGPPAW
jgi:hypothetical protein